MKLGKNLELDAEVYEEINAFLKERPGQILQIPGIRKIVAKNRLNKVTEDDFECIKSEDSQAHALKHNLSQLKVLEAYDRPTRLIEPLLAIDIIRGHLRHLKVLCIGPRTESELLVLYAKGFSPDNIHALDIISYTDLIQVGDVHSMPYADDEFDIVIAGWVFAYSNDNQKMANEMLRVCKSGGFFSIGCRTESLGNAENREQAAKHTGGIQASVEYGDGTINTASRFVNTDQIFRLFSKNIDTVYFNHNPHPEYTDKDLHSDAIVIFTSKKEAI